MKKVLVIVAFGILLAGTASAQSIVGSAHDLSDSNGGGYTENELCRFCHTPHNALASTAPLWNHTDTAASWTMYSSTTMNETAAVPAGSVSRACLSCHDGTVQVDAYQGGTPSATIGAVTANLGTDLSNDHPIGVNLDAAIADGDGELNASGTLSIAQLFGTGEVECASCHDVHNTSNSFMLLDANDISALCRDCHNK